MVTKKYVGSDLDVVRAEIERDCGSDAKVLFFRYSKPRGIRRLFFGPRVEVVVELSTFEPSTQAKAPGDFFSTHTE